MIDIPIITTIPKLSPFIPYFGGKGRIASFVWKLLGNPKVYIEPFVGGGAVFLNRPYPIDPRYHIEIISDVDGLVINLWRAIKYNRKALEDGIERPISEVELNCFLNIVRKGSDLIDRMEEDETFVDIKLGIAYAYILGVSKHLFWGERVVPMNLKLSGLMKRCYWVNGELDNYLTIVYNRLKHTTIFKRDWKYVMQWIDEDRDFKTYLKGIYFDPPYETSGKDNEKFYKRESQSVESEVYQYAHLTGDDPTKRIVFSSTKDYPELIQSGWTRYRWKRKEDNLEYIYASPHCLKLTLL